MSKRPPVSFSPDLFTTAVMLWLVWKVLGAHVFWAITGTWLFLIGLTACLAFLTRGAGK